MKTNPTLGLEKTARAETAKNPVKPIKRRLLIPLATVFLLLVGGFSIVLFNIQQDNKNQASLKIREDTIDELSESLAEQSRALATLEEILLHDADLRDALKRQDRPALLAAYGDVFARLRQEHSITHLYFYDPDRVNLLRVYNPAKHGDLIDRFTTLETERTGKMGSGIELGSMGTFTLRVVRPAFDGKTLIGYLELGKEIEDILVKMDKIEQYIRNYLEEK